MDSQASFYPAPSGVNITICLNPKVGSTRWKMLMVQAKGIKVSPDVFQIHRTSVPWLTMLHGRPGYWRENGNEKNLRVMFVRNPYTRLLSGFLDKGVLWGTVYPIKPGHREPYSATPAEFKRFIQALIARRDAGMEMDMHFELQSRLCGGSAGYQYNFYLKVEEIDVWYVDFVSLLGIGHTAARGWKQYTTDGYACFFALRGKTCDETSEIIRNHYANPVDVSPNAENSGEPSWALTKTSHHAQGANRQISTYYADVETLELATGYLMQDIRRFGYPILRAGEL
uniref:Sulfotransferase n=1 Tax=Tetraselmis chuii TaxID=63592 RepID=A0A7S1SLL3_9CHLO|mmetsp:Transcript_17848/g.31809  ORF Transcript_17848/g.31809 Transcript_17848/m.31809 type:complete len:284 (+) Transcript_17848:258-1109(+)